jgi:hypothetical protein
LSIENQLINKRNKNERWSFKKVSNHDVITQFLNS